MAGIAKCKAIVVAKWPSGCIVFRRIFAIRIEIQPGWTLIDQYVFPFKKETTDILEYFSKKKAKKMVVVVCCDRALGPKKNKGNGKCVLKKISALRAENYYPNSPKKVMLPTRDVKSKTSFA